MIVNLTLQCTDNIQHKEVSSQTEKKTFLLIKAMMINKKNKKIKDRMRTTGHLTPSK